MKSFQPVHVAAKNQRRGDQRPERDVGVLLVGRKRRPLLAVRPHDIAQEEIIGVVPAAGPGELVQLAIGVKAEDVGKDFRVHYPVRRPTDVAGGPPTVAAGGTPFPDVAPPVLAKVKHDVAIELLQFTPHQLVGFLPVGEVLSPGDGPVGAPVVLEKIEAPRGEAPRVVGFVLIAAEVAGAVGRPGRTVDARLEAAAMDVVG